MLTVTLCSLVVAAASGFIAWRSVRREHLRTDARVAWLASAIDSSPGHDAALDDAFDCFSQEAQPPVPVAAIFEEHTHPAARRRPLLTAGAGLAVVLAVVVLIAITGDRYDPPTQPVVSPHAESLELLSLHAAREGSTLAVTGLVRSRAEEPLTTVTAVVSAIDAKGRPIGRGSVRLAALMPRRESRFVVTIDAVNEAARYRVSFRSATGVIRHVDRRADRTSDVS